MAEEPSMVIKYWGVRGSIPTSLVSKDIREKEIALIRKIQESGGITKLFGEELDQAKIDSFMDSLDFPVCNTYGGDTTCIEIQAKDSPLIIYDAGTGVRQLGNTLLGRLFSKEKNINPLNTNEDFKKSIHIFFSHYHWDHLQGFPFFGPGFLKENNRVDVQFYGKADARRRISQVLANQQQYPNFPVEFYDMPCVVNKKQYHQLGRMTPSPIKLGNAEICYAELDHPDKVFAYSIISNAKKFVGASDTEHRDKTDPDLIKLAMNADILYYDGQFLPEEYSGETGMHRFRWGHSTPMWAVLTGFAANVDTVVIGHHDPQRGDFKLKELDDRTQKYRDEIGALPENKGKHLNVVIAYQGLEQRL
jgi:phosphoribosyl 1,2-cyclic phosphodiesterase